MERVISKAFRNRNAELCEIGERPGSVENVLKIGLCKIRRISSLEKQQRVRNTISEQFASVRRFAIAIRNAALKFACKQQSAQNSFLRAIAAHLL